MIGKIVCGCILGLPPPPPPSPTSLPPWAVPVIVAGGVAVLVFSVVGVVIVASQRSANAGAPIASALAAGGVSAQKVDVFSNKNARRYCSNCGGLIPAAAWAGREELSPYPFHAQPHATRLTPYQSYAIAHNR